MFSLIKRIMFSTSVNALSIHMYVQKVVNELVIAGEAQGNSTFNYEPMPSF